MKLGFRCLRCTQFRNECNEDFVDRNQKIDNEPCNGRCYIRKAINNGSLVSEIFKKLFSNHYFKAFLYLLQ